MEYEPNLGALANDELTYSANMVAVIVAAKVAAEREACAQAILSIRGLPEGYNSILRAIAATVREMPNGADNRIPTARDGDLETT